MIRHTDDKTGPLWLKEMNRPLLSVPLERYWGHLCSPFCGTQPSVLMRILNENMLSTWFYSRHVQIVEISE